MSDRQEKERRRQARQQAEAQAAAAMRRRYPSINDPGADQARSVGAGLGWPTTIFYDAKGKRRFVRQGGYTSQGSLDADIRAYALS